MTVKQRGSKFVVYSDAGEVLGAYSCRGEAEREDARQRAAAIPADVPDIEEEEAEEETKDLEEESPKFICPHCYFVAKTSFGLTSHIRAKHGE